MEGVTFVEKSVNVCGRFTLVGGFTFDGVTATHAGKKKQIFKCSEYHYWPCLAKLGQVREFWLNWAEVGQVQNIA